MIFNLITKFHLTTFIENIWFWIAVIEFFLLICLFVLKKKKYPDSHLKTKKNIIKETIDFENIINSSFNSKQIYDELIRKCHPDRFTHNAELNIIATNISKEITKNKNDIKKLQELKIEAKNKLNINI